MEHSLGKFSGSEYRDLYWGIAFLVQLFALVGFAVYTLVSVDWSNANRDPNNIRPNPADDETVRNPNRLLASVGCAFGASVAATVGLLLLLKSFARQFIWVTNFFQMGLVGLSAITAFAVGNVGVGVTLTAVFCFNGVWLFFVRHRVYFASVVLAAAAEVVFSHLGTIGVALLGMFSNAVYLTLWAIALIGTWNRFPVLRVFLIISLFWSSQVWKNVVHVTVAGTAATWYFMYQSMPPNPTVGALRRTTTTSFGSVCLGSLVVALLQALRLVVQSMRRENETNFVSFCADCILSWLDALMQYFNEYAYCQVAIYGKPYIQAAKDTWALVKNCGLTAVINDTLISTALQLACLVFSVLAGLLATLAAGDWSQFWAYFVLATVVAYVMMATVVSVLTSTIITLYVCYAEEPQALEVSNRELADLLHDAVTKIALGENYFVVGRPVSEVGGGAHYYTQNQSYGS